MNTEAWYRQRSDRSLRYAGRVLPHDRPILLRLCAESASRYDAQVAALVAANLLARMTPAVAFDLPETKILPSLPWAGKSLRSHLKEIMFAADPLGSFEIRDERKGDYVLTLGRHSDIATVHGSGWNAFVGRGPSPLPDGNQLNPLGPALAVIIAVARLFALEMVPIDGPHLFNAFNWRSEIVDDNGAPEFEETPDLGSIWSVGVGSVGTAALYFLALATRRFSATLFDMDRAKVENLDRSPIFSACDADNRSYKVDAVAAYLRSIGVQAVRSEPKPLHESSIWFAREAGAPDIIISAANEFNVRYTIEQSAPPLQIYGTTGANWEASVIRHIPFVDPCSCCLFPPDAPVQPTVCATETTVERATGETVDASLPFLSFGAGLMTAAEILKAQLPGYPFSPNRTTLNTHAAGPPRFVSSIIPHRPNCLCADRSPLVHRRLIGDSRYAALSRPALAAKAPTSADEVR